MALRSVTKCGREVIHSFYGNCVQIYNKNTNSLGLIGLLAMLEGLTGNGI